jgi:hypothetical protein
VNRHKVAERINAARREARWFPAFTEGQRLAAVASIDSLARDLAEELPGAQRDAFLIACGVPRTEPVACPCPTGPCASGCSQTPTDVHRALKLRGF